MDEKWRAIRHAPRVCVQDSYIDSDGEVVPARYERDYSHYPDDLLAAKRRYDDHTKDLDEMYSWTEPRSRSQAHIGVRPDRFLPNGLPSTTETFVKYHWDRVNDLKAKYSL